MHFRLFYQLRRHGWLIHLKLYIYYEMNIKASKEFKIDMSNQNNITQLYEHKYIFNSLYRRRKALSSNQNTKLQNGLKDNNQQNSKENVLKAIILTQYLQGELISQITSSSKHPPEILSHPEGSKFTCWNKTRTERARYLASSIEIRPKTHFLIKNNRYEMNESEQLQQQNKSQKEAKTFFKRFKNLPSSSCPQIYIKNNQTYKIVSSKIFNKIELLKQHARSVSQQNQTSPQKDKDNIHSSHLSPKNQIQQLFTALYKKKHINTKNFKDKIKVKVKQGKIKQEINFQPLHKFETKKKIQKEEFRKQISSRKSKNKNEKNLSGKWERGDRLAPWMVNESQLY